MTDSKPKDNRGGPGRGQGRKAIVPGEHLAVVSIRTTHEQKEKLARLGGGEWVRKKIDQAKEPKA